MSGADMGNAIIVIWILVILKIVSVLKGPKCGCSSMGLGPE